jgi:hypothetical protein
MSLRARNRHVCTHRLHSSRCTPIAFIRRAVDPFPWSAWEP